MVKYALISLAVLAAATGASAGVTDPMGDFLPTYTGAHNGDLDILSASVVFTGSEFRFSSTLNGIPGSTADTLFVWAVNRGAGLPLYTFGTPSIGAGINFDAVVVFTATGDDRVVQIIPEGVLIPLPGASHVSGHSIGGVAPLSLLPSNGFAPADYIFTFLTRLHDPSDGGTNSDVADFAPDASGFRASVPEPATWAMLITGLGFAGAVLRRRGAMPAAIS